MTFFILFLRWLRLSLRLSTFLMEIKFMVSRKTADLIFRSRGVSVASEGLKFTSISQGFKSVSIRIS